MLATIYSTRFRLYARRFIREVASPCTSSLLIDSSCIYTRSLFTVSIPYLDLQWLAIEPSDKGSFMPPHGPRRFVGEPLYALP